MQDHESLGLFQSTVIPRYPLGEGLGLAFESGQGLRVRVEGLGVWG